MLHDYLIIGAGPAGLQLGYFFEKANRDYEILEASDNVAHFFREQPRHRKLISINKVHTGFDDPEINLRWDWNSLINDKLFFTSYTKSYMPPADKLTEYLEDFKNDHGLKVKFNFKVTNVTRDEHGFTLTSENAEVKRCKQLIVATGLSQLNIPDFPGVEHAEPYTTCSIDPEDYLNKRVLIVGKGNSALETADNLIETTASVHLCSPEPVKLAWNTHFVGNIRAINNNFLDTYQLKSQNVILDADIKSIEKRGDKLYVNICYTHAKGELRTIPYDHVILATGFKFNNTHFDETCCPELSFSDKLPTMTNRWESTNVPNLFFAGTLMQMRDYKKTMSGFIHGFRHNIAALSKMFSEHNHGEAWPAETFPLEPRKVALTLIDRINRSAAMFLQPGFFCDLLIEHEDGSASFVPDVPKDYVQDSAFSRESVYYTISLEYGDYSLVRDSFNIDRDPDPAKAHLIEYLHPIIRKFSAGKLINEHHLVEDVENVYSAEPFISSIEQYFATQSLDVSLKST